MSKNTTSKGLMWRTIEGIGSQGMQFFVQLFLARLLLPEDFGVIAILNVFINIANTFVNSGLTSGLLQKKDSTKLDFSTVFYVEFLVAIVMYIAIYFLAPFVSTFYENPKLTSYLRVFALTIILGSLGSIQTATLRYKLDFKSSCIANLIAILMQGISGVFFALHNFGVWSLILSQIVYRLTAFLFLLIFARWIPMLRFSFQSFKRLFAYSWKLFVGWLIGTIYVDLFSLIIGRVYDDKTLGFYSKGNSIPSAINRVVTQTTTAVMFPAIAKSQDNFNKVKYQTRTMISLTAALILPIMAGVAAVAEPFVMVVLTSKWAGAIPVIQIICISSAINVVNNSNMQSFNAIGRSDVFLRCEIIKRSITILLVFIFANIDFNLMLFSMVIMGVFSLVLNSFYNKKLLSYTRKEQAIDILPYFVYSMLFFSVIYCLNFIHVNYFVKLLIQLLACVVIYLASVFFIKLNAFVAIKRFAVSIFKNKSKTNYNDSQNNEEAIAKVEESNLLEEKKSYIPCSSKVKRKG